MKMIKDMVKESFIVKMEEVRKGFIKMEWSSERVES
jgi:hypothetical protein